MSKVFYMRAKCRSSSLIQNPVASHDLSHDSNWFVFAGSVDKKYILEILEQVEVPTFQPRSGAKSYMYSVFVCGLTTLTVMIPFPIRCKNSRQ